MARTPITSDQRLLLTGTEAADLLGVSRDVFREDIAPDLRCVQVRGTWRYSRRELERWIEKHEHTPAVSSRAA
jgi:excisionase family DNA binding protein